MSLPTPVPGLVIRYSYLWREAHLRGEVEGRKDRPCAIILATASQEGEMMVTVLPVTHSPPADNRQAIEIPSATKRRLGLDGERSWVVLTEANRFVWPGPDLRPARGAPLSSAVYGSLPRMFYDRMRRAFIAQLRAHQARVVSRKW